MVDAEPPRGPGWEDLVTQAREQREERRLKTDQALDELGLGALFHDIGMLRVPDAVRMKPETEWTKADRAYMQRHTDPGTKMTLNLPGFGTLARRFKIENKNFDPVSPAGLIKCLGVYPPGSLLELSNGALGLIASVNCNSTLRQLVTIWQENCKPEDAPIGDLAVATELKIERALCPTALEPQVQEFLNPRARTAYFSKPKLWPPERHRRRAHRAGRLCMPLTALRLKLRGSRAVNSRESAGYVAPSHLLRRRGGGRRREK